MDTVLYNLKVMNSKLIVHISNVGLLTDVSFYPVGFNAFLALMVDIPTSKHKAGTDMILSFERESGQLGMASNDIAFDLYLLLMNSIYRIIDLDISLKTLFNEYLFVIVFNSDNNLKGILFKRRYFVSKVRRVLVDWDPDAHGVCLNETIQ